MNAVAKPLLQRPRNKNAIARKPLQDSIILKSAAKPTERSHTALMPV
jgi:hypothetical protein